MKARRDVSQHLKLWRWWEMESARTKYQISSKIFLCCRSAFRECGVHGSEPVCIGWGCRQEDDFTVICLPGEVWVRLSALLVKAGAKLETDYGPTRMGDVRFEWGLKPNIESLHHPEETLNPVQPWTFIVESRLA